MQRLEIGPGDLPIKDKGVWDTLDCCPDFVNPEGGKQILCEWGKDPIPVDDNTYDLVYCSHVIEHISWYKTVEALEEVYRILKPGGTLEIWTVDFGILVKNYLDGTTADTWKARGKNPDLDPFTWLLARLFCFDNNGYEQYWHRSAFDYEHLTKCIRKAGFMDSRKLDISENRNREHKHINLGIVGIK